MTRAEEIQNAMKESVAETIYVSGYGFTPQATDLLECAFIKGAEWADKTMLERAKEYLENNIDKDLIIYYNNTWKKRDEFIKDFIKAMKGGAE